MVTGMKPHISNISATVKSTKQTEKDEEIPLLSWPEYWYQWKSPLSTRFPQDSEVRQILPVTAASPAHACGGRRAAEEPVLTAFSHVGTEMFKRSLRRPHGSSGCSRQPLLYRCSSENAKRTLSLLNWSLWAPLVNWAGGGAAGGGKGDQVFFVFFLEEGGWAVENELEGERKEMKSKQSVRVWQLQLQ